MAEIRFPNGRTADLPIDMNRLWVEEKDAPGHILRICGFQNGDDITRADEFFAWLDEAGSEVVSKCIIARNEIFLDAMKEGMEIDDSFDFSEITYC